MTMRIFLRKFTPLENDVSAATSQSPTLTKGTALGAIMGTASYMSPEQARGKVVDKRTDIWAFGCCLFEALTGEKVFEGETVADVLGGVVKSEPHFDRLRSGIPAQIHELLRRALVKDPHERLRDIGDARIELRAERSATPEDVYDVRRGSRRVLPWGIAATAAVAAVSAWLTRGPVRPTSSRPARFTIEIPADQRPGMDLDEQQIVLSRDGTRVAWIGARGSLSALRRVRGVRELVGGRYSGRCCRVSRRGREFFRQVLRSQVVEEF